MGIHDYGTALQPLSQPSLAKWAASVADYVTGADTWTAWTPTFSGGTLQSSTCQFQRTPGGLVTVQAKLTIATITGSVAFGLPAGPAAQDGALWTELVLASSTRWMGSTGIDAGSSSAVVRAATATGSLTNLTPTVPFTWTAGSSIRISGTYRI